MTPQKQVSIVNKILGLASGAFYKRIEPDAAGEIVRLMKSDEFTPVPLPRIRDTATDDALWVLTHKAINEQITWSPDHPWARGFHPANGWYLWSGSSVDMGGLNGPVRLDADMFSLPAALLCSAVLTAREFVRRWEENEGNARRESEADYLRAKEIFGRSPWCYTVYDGESPYVDRY